MTCKLCTEVFSSLAIWHAVEHKQLAQCVRQVINPSNAEAQQSNTVQALGLANVKILQSDVTCLPTVHIARKTQRHGANNQ